MQTLQQLRSGELKGVKELKLSENLSSFPMEIIDLSDTLEILDLSNNQLSEIPEEIAKLKKLKIAFFSYNKFTEMPSSLKECKNLYMLGFKANKIELFDEDILPLSISWLIFTDNRLKSLPYSIGKLTKLQKFPLAGNQLETLPDSMKNCINLELIRLSANNLKSIPPWLLMLPKLSWLSFSGNPCSISKDSNIKEVSHDELEISCKLGSGASGDIYKVYSKELQKIGALKLFKGEVTSDGYAKDEMNAYVSIKKHPNLIKVLAKLKEQDKLGLLLEFIPPSFVNLGNPPNFDTCSRDTFDKDLKFSLQTIKLVAKSILSVSIHLHKSNLMHGDLYAHNILIDSENSCYLGDFGAASFYDKDNKSFEKIEVRAFACLLDDMLSRCVIDDVELYDTLNIVKINCMNENIQERPFFEDIII